MPNHFHRRRPSWIDWRAGYINRPPVAALTGLPAQYAWNNLSQWRYNGTVYEYNCPPDSLIGCDGSEGGEFHFVIRMPDKADDTVRRLGIGLLYWAIDTRGDVVTVKWYDPHNEASPATVWTIDGEQSSAAGYGTYINPGNCHLFYDEITYDPNAAGWRHVKIKVEHMLVAALAVWHMPEETLPSEQLLITAGNMSSGRVIRGYNGSEVGSLGRVIHNTGLGGAVANHDSIEAVTRKVLFQSGHPVCNYHTWSSAAWENPFNLGEFTTYPRHLVDDADREAYPVLVVAGISAGCKIRYTSTTGADTWTYTEGAGIAWDTPTVIDYSMGTGGTLGAGRGLYIDGNDWDEVVIELYGTAEGAGDEVYLRSWGLFEDEAWD